MKYFFVIIFLIFLSLAYSQKENYHWVFGNGAELDFTQTPPNIVPNNSMEASLCNVATSMSDYEGKLLFYTNFNNIWTHNHTLMENGKHFLSGVGFSINSCYLSCMSIQSPKSNTLYYNFYNRVDNNLFIPGELILVEIDMLKNGGLGSVINKEILPLELNGEHLGIASHSNNKDYWLLTIGMDNKLHANLIDNNGVSSNSVISNLATNSQAHTSRGIWGYIICSHDMKYMVISASQCNGNTGDNLFFYSFDNATGKAKCLWSLKTISEYIEGIEFSPDNNYIYVLCGLPRLKKGLIQIKLEENKNVLPTKITKLASIYGGGMSLAPDGRIYISYGTDSLSVINKPNLEGRLCDLQLNNIYLHGKKSGNKLPRFQKRISYTFTCNISCQTAEFNFSPCKTQEWDFGDGTTSTETNPSHIYDAPGTYTVKLKATYNDGTVHTSTKKIEINAKLNNKLVILHD